MDYLNDPVLFPGGNAGADTEPDVIPVPAEIPVPGITTEPDTTLEVLETPLVAVEEAPAPADLLPPAATPELDAVLSHWLLKIDEDVSAARDSLLAAGYRFAEDAQVQIDAAAALAKADLQGVMLETMEEAGFQAGENIVKLLALELGGFADKIEQNTSNMLAATQRMHETASKGPAIPSRFVWFVTGAVSFWLVTKYIDLARWAAIGEAVIKSLKGAV